MVSNGGSPRTLLYHSHVDAARRNIESALQYAEGHELEIALQLIIVMLAGAQMLGPGAASS